MNDVEKACTCLFTYKNYICAINYNNEVLSNKKYLFFCLEVLVLPRFIYQPGDTNS